MGKTRHFFLFFRPQSKACGNSKLFSQIQTKVNGRLKCLFALPATWWEQAVENHNYVILDKKNLRGI